MQRKRLNSGQLRAAGYDESRRILEVELSNGQVIEYAGVGREIARRLLESSSAWSYYRDNIVDEYSAHPAGRVRPAGAAEDPFA